MYIYCNAEGYIIQVDFGSIRHVTKCPIHDACSLNSDDMVSAIY